MIKPITFLRVTSSWSKPPCAVLWLALPVADQARALGRFNAPMSRFQCFSMPRSGVRLPPAKDYGIR
ncbi:MAG: hypothetical protein A2045_14055 [Rhodocyclales bacterium GWA2_65_20]|nr:MAG: hypothetical protein A2045_14055 [Rhodocyclales bacterium GWA2_65_20]